MSKVTLTTELPIPAEAACALALKPELFKYVVRPILRVPAMDFPEHVEPGISVSARLWWFGIIPAWTHHLTLVRLGDTEIYTNEHGGPVRTWNHHLTFTPIDERRCRYTDEIETEDGLRGAVTRLFIRLMFRHRHRRWRTLTRILA
ncbi:ligand-binding SRPBCC domain-containing protein [Nocardia transvalensis]|uniref:Ligand-binding SRPBCC domain-containing protein n=1 Tax=Nocardia transvalensis TaxID=37333 RepID=A0A7W9PJ15_9NOCA|nr:hypothetical protein [Nocardia transvalensis]MBB5916977.1 ligand-binding SRPBCC domain-containing protein [Nocardia transvalensis]